MSEEKERIEKCEIQKALINNNIFNDSQDKQDRLIDIVMRVMSPDEIIDYLIKLRDRNKLDKFLLKVESNPEIYPDVIAKRLLKEHKNKDFFEKQLADLTRPSSIPNLAQHGITGQDFLICAGLIKKSQNPVDMSNALIKLKQEDILDVYFGIVDSVRKTEDPLVVANDIINTIFCDPIKQSKVRLQERSNGFSADELVVFQRHFLSAF